MATGWGSRANTLRFPPARKVWCSRTWAVRTELTLNGELLNPGQEYPLRHGDHLSIGQLGMELLFAVVPTEEASELPMQLDETPVLGTGKQILAAGGQQQYLTDFCDGLCATPGLMSWRKRQGRRRLDLMAQALPDAIVMNVSLPDVGADEFIAYVREHSTIPIILVAMVGEDATAFEAPLLEAGADAFFDAADFARQPDPHVECVADRA